MTRIDAALRDARARGVASLDAQLLLAHVTGLSRTALIAHGERLLSAAEHARWATALERRRQGEPLAYLVGTKEFCGLLLEVGPAVLVPRPDTELLVDWASELVGAPGQAACDLLDLGTGSGAVALAIKHRHPQTQVTATDVSLQALAVARANGRRLGLAVTWAEGSWWQPLGEQRFDVVLSNPPYVAEGDPHLAALRHEPEIALSAGIDGLACIRAIVRDASAHLHGRGGLLLEHGFDQAAAVRELLHEAGLFDVETRSDLAGQPRASGGRRAG